MKRSLPVLLGLSALAVLALLVAGGFLSLPLTGGEASEDVPVHDPAPIKNAQPLDVAFEDGHGKEADKNDKQKKRGKKDGKKQNKRDSKKGKQQQNSKNHDGSTTRTSPKLSDRKTPKKQGGVEPRKNNDSPNDPPPDPAPVVVSDLRGDPEGEGAAPGYMDLEGVQLRATGDVFVAQLSFAGRIPAQMPNDQQAMLTSLEVKKPNGGEVSVYAEASDDGWRAHTNKSAEFPGSMAIDGRTITFTVPRSFFGERFGWYTYSSWTKSTLTNTDYFFDFAPDDQNGQFPSGGTT